MRTGPALSLAVATLALAGCGMFRTADTQPRGQVTLRVADAALQSGAPDMALRIADLVLQQQPDNVDALVTRGDALYALGAAEPARAAYRLAVAADSKDIAAQIGLGRTLVRSDPGEAETHFRAALAQQPDNVIALNNLGIARDMQGRHADAQQAYREALALMPDMADVKTNLGLSLALSGQGQQAVRVLQPLATAPEATPMKRADLAVAMAQARDTGPMGPVKEQSVQTATAHYDAPLAIGTAPVAAVATRPLRPMADAVPQPAPEVPVARAALVVQQPEPPPPALATAVAAPALAAAAVAPAEAPTAPTAEAPALSAGPRAVMEGIYVQVASLDSEQAARSEWQKLRSRWPDLLTGHEPAVVQADVRERKYWRLRTGGFTSVGDASEFCARLRTAGGDCWTVGVVGRS
ncbi:MAG: tetratricopeptide repeat protein [Acetobacteraceae bacterium]